MSYSKCHGCHGQKTTIGLGMLHHKCKECDGVGYISADDIESIKEDLKEDPKVAVFQDAPPVQKIRRGRPKKSQF